MSRKFIRRTLFLAVAMTAPLLVPPAALPLAGTAVAAELQAKEGWYRQLADTDFVKRQIAIPPNPDVTIIDARPAARQYDPGHIRGAINIPDSKFDDLIGALPADKSKLVILYCGGLECPLSHNVAHKMEKLGYSNLKVYAEGVPEWVKQGGLLAVSTAYVKKLLDEKDKGGEKFMLIDARPKRVFDQGAIPGAAHISDSEFEKHTDKLPADKSTLLVYYCNGFECPLSDKSAEKAHALGYTNVKTYAEGWPAWSKAYPTMSQAMGAMAGAAANVAAQMVKKAVEIVPGKEKGSISAPSFDKLMKESPEQVLVIDVRDAKEYAAATIKGAINIPINQLEKRIDELPTNKPVIFACGTGARAGEGYDTVKLLRPEVQAWFLDVDMKFNGDGSYTITKAR